MSKELTQDQALSVLIQGAKLAQSKGAFSLEDAALIADAIKVFAPKTPEDAGAPVAKSEDSVDEAAPTESEVTAEPVQETLTKG